MTTKKYPLTNDCVFHIVFGREETKNNLLYLLNTVFAEIGLPLTENVTIMNPIDYGEAVQVKSVVFDIKAKTSNDNLVNIEMQREDSSNYISRSYIYLSRIHGEQLKKGDKYEQIKPTYGG